MDNRIINTLTNMFSNHTLRFVIGSSLEAKIVMIFFTEIGSFYTNSNMQKRMMEVGSIGLFFILYMIR